MKKLLLIILIFPSLSLFSQENLVPNGGFDDNTNYLEGNDPVDYFTNPNWDSTKTKKNDVHQNIHYGFSINQSLTRYGLPTSALFTLHCKKHQFDLGPLFRLGKSINGNQKNIGIGFNYRFYTKADTSLFSSFLLLNIDYFYEYYKRSGGIYFSDNPLLNEQPTSQESITHNLALNVGYGIKFRLLDGFYLGSHVGIGLHSPNFSTKNTMVNVDWNSIQKSTEYNLGFVIAFSIGYKF